MCYGDVKGTRHPTDVVEQPGLLSVSYVPVAGRLAKHTHTSERPRVKATLAEGPGRHAHRNGDPCFGEHQASICVCLCYVTSPSPQRPCG